MAAAVLRPTGSARIWELGTRGSSRRTAEACSAFVTTQQFFSAKTGTRRLTVSRSMVSPLVILRSCFGVRARLRGQKRVPRPPARRTAQAGRLPGVFLRVTETPGVLRQLRWRLDESSRRRLRRDLWGRRCAGSWYSIRARVQKNRGRRESTRLARVRTSRILSPNVLNRRL